MERGLWCRPWVDQPQNRTSLPNTSELELINRRVLINLGPAGELFPLTARESLKRRDRVVNMPGWVKRPRTA